MLLILIANKIVIFVVLVQLCCFSLAHAILHISASSLSTKKPIAVSSIYLLAVYLCSQRANCCLVYLLAVYLPKGANCCLYLLVVYLSKGQLLCLSISSLSPKGRQPDLRVVFRIRRRARFFTRRDLGRSPREGEVRVNCPAGPIFFGC